MERLKFYKIIIFGLLLLNIALIAFVFLGPHRQHRTSDSRRSKPKAIKDLDLSESQHEQFLSLAKPHIKAIRQLERQQRAVLQPYFMTLSEENEKEENLDSLLVELQRIERQKIETTYAHFKEVKSILTPEQQAKFPNFISKALRIILGEQGRERKNARRRD